MGLSPLVDVPTFWFMLSHMRDIQIRWLMLLSKGDYAPCEMDWGYALRFWGTLFIVHAEGHSFQPTLQWSLCIGFLSFFFFSQIFIGSFCAFLIYFDYRHVLLWLHHPHTAYPFS